VRFLTKKPAHIYTYPKIPDEMTKMHKKRSKSQKVGRQGRGM
jgi:hypothetical protein